MSTHEHIDRICAAVTALCLLAALLLMDAQALGIQPASQVMGYEATLFDTSKVHTVEILLDDWDGFIDTCEDEEYAACSVVIDNEAYKNVGIRAKGNTSLSTVSQLGSSRYSFKLEFDNYDSGKTYHGLDKLCLNNIIQDDTYMKDYLTYRMMAAFDVAAPLCSYVYITVNGEDWGLYLAVEGIEDAFLQRNYGQDSGELYKPDSMSFGAGRGNGRDLDMDELVGQGPWEQGQGQGQGRPGGMQPPGTQNGEGSEPSPGGQWPDWGDRTDVMPEAPDLSAAFGGGFGGRFGGIGSDDVKLRYVDDDPDSYPNLFSSAKTDVSKADEARLIRSLKALGEGGDVSDVVDIDQVLRYFVVHDFVVNDDSYTGAMVHNYYLYEKDGKLSMLPWDYNLAFGTFHGGDASGAVNDPIDTPLSVSGDGDRPMADWIFASEEYTELYHRYFEEFLSTVDPSVIIEEAYALIAPYVERDPTKFCTYEDFETGVETLRAFCALRIRSISGQLDGTIPSTSAGQAADPGALVDATSLDLSLMGTMDAGGRPGRDGTPSGDGIPAFGPGGDMAAPQIFQQPGGEETDPSAQFSEADQRPAGLSPGGFGADAPNAGTQATGEGGALLLTGLSAAVLLLGLAVTAAFRSRR